MTIPPTCPVVDDPDLPVVPEHEAHRAGAAPKAKRTKRAADALTRRYALVGSCAIPGVSLTNYSINAKSKGWGDPCTQGRTTITLTNGVRITVASRIARLSTLVLNEIIRRGYIIRQVDTGAYNCRYISGTTVWSNHAWALAIDVNWQTNPYTRSTITDKPDWLFKLMNRYGFANGADYSGKHDWMHHEFMGTPTQADQATALAERELPGGSNYVVKTSPITKAMQVGMHYPAADRDGIWGPQTDRDVYLIRQASYGGAFPDGVTKVQKLIGTKQTGTWDKSADDDALRSTVAVFQRAWGLGAGDDGYWGPVTERAWKSFQARLYAG
jgi:hypothetical protein